jgi:hypothetical protein
MLACKNQQREYEDWHQEQLEQVVSRHWPYAGANRFLYGRCFWVKHTNQMHRAKMFEAGATLCDCSDASIA